MLKKGKFIKERMVVRASQANLELTLLHLVLAMNLVAKICVQVLFVLQKIYVSSIHLAILLSGPSWNSRP